ncbi:related to RTT107 - Establishes Silent Chromatin [Cephalotrichum gorgonifer]|uniref:Related to RTT107 - Establishes Silent Chromatin n=1 Tax=Cephalotrichum gorgonifer TaxID=2041049 RepID=A0AAE8SXK1_9PEZI|nr:related to RTT107 - Establishes Silent Chromatin [Cephalotrichum gorgonifer]
MSKQLFAQCSVAFVSSSELTSQRISELSAIIKNNGGEICEPRYNGLIPIEKVSHIISNTIDFPQYAEAQALMIPVLTDSWIQLSLSKSRLAQIRPFSPDPRMIFSSVVITCAGLPTMDKEGIIGATAALGGMDSPVVTKMTTHICALSADDPMCQDAKANGFRAKIVLPHWFDDCFKLGKRISEGPYLLPDPEILRDDPQRSIEMPSSQHIQGATTAQPRHIPSSTQSARTTLSVFKMKKVMLAQDLALSSRLRDIINEIITDSSGQITDNVEECNMFVCQYRDGPDYVRAAKLCKEVGNLSWLYHLITTDQWSSPFRRLLHYPIPKNGIPGFEDFKITLSNYGGDARPYLVNLIKAAGATFTKTMKAENTHLITARDNSEKCEAAADWGINMVNHLWIEESYAKCKVQPYTNKKYTHFPSRTNLGEVIGQTFFDEAILRDTYYPGEDDDLPPSAKRRRLILEAAQANAYENGPAEGVVIGREDAKVWREEMTKQVPVTPAPKRHVALGKENDTPLSTGSRSAKMKAAATLRLLGPDIDQYEKEKKRHAKDGKGPWGGKRAADKLDQAREEANANKEKKDKTTKKARQEDEEDEGEEDVEEEEKRPAKKRKKAEKPYNITVTITGYKRWAEDPKKEDKDRMKLLELGIKVAAEKSACQYLVAPRILRTLKFLCGLIRGATIISTDFIDHVLTSREIVSPDDFVLKDPEGEKFNRMKLDKSVARARANAGKLLWGVPIYCTPYVRHGAKTYEAIAVACHAIWKTYDGKHTTIKKVTPEEDGGVVRPDPVYLITSNTAAEQGLFEKFRKMAGDGNMEARIVSPDWLLDVVMRQEVDYDGRFAVEEE